MPEKKRPSFGKILEWLVVSHESENQKETRCFGFGEMNRQILELYKKGLIKNNGDVCILAKYRGKWFQTSMINFGNPSVVVFGVPYNVDVIK